MRCLRHSRGTSSFPSCQMKFVNHILKNNFLTLENMALEVSNITDFQKFFDGVMGQLIIMLIQ